MLSPGSELLSIGRNRLIAADPNTVMMLFDDETQEFIGNFTGTITQSFFMTKDDQKNNGSVFDLSSEEREARLEPVTDQVARDLFAKGLPLTYRDERCPTDDHFIQEYEDGRIHLVLFDMHTRQTKLVKVLKDA